MENIIRKPYLDKIEQALGKDIIIVLVGQRRIGKSYLLRQLREERLKTVLPTSSLWIRRRRNLTTSETITI